MSSLQKPNDLQEDDKDGEDTSDDEALGKKKKKKKKKVCGIINSIHCALLTYSTGLCSNGGRE